MRTLRTSDFDARDTRKKYNGIARMRERIILVIMKHYFSPAESTFSSQGFLGEIALKKVLQKTSLHNEKDSNSAEEVEL